MPEGNGKRTISNHLNNARKQIRNNEGGLILDCTNMKYELTDLMVIVLREINRKKFKGDVVIKKRNELIGVFRYEE